MWRKNLATPTPERRRRGVYMDNAVWGYIEGEAEKHSRSVNRHIEHVFRERMDRCKKAKCAS